MLARDDPADDYGSQLPIFLHGVQHGPLRLRFDYPQRRKTLTDSRDRNTHRLLCDKMTTGRRHDMILLVAIARVHTCYGGSWLSPLEIDDRGSRLIPLCFSTSCVRITS